MKKRFLALVLAVLTVLAFAACGKKGEDEQKGGEAETADNSILAQMEPANATKTLVDKYESILMVSKDRDGNETSTCMQVTDGGYNLIMKDYTGAEIAMTPKGNFVLTSDGESNANLYESEADYEARRDEIISAPIYTYSPDETVVEEKEEGDKKTVLTMRHMDNTADGYEELKNLWGIDDETFDYYNQYVIDSKTLEILESEAYCEISTGRIDINHVTIAHGEVLEMSEGMAELIENAK